LLDNIYRTLFGIRHKIHLVLLYYKYEDEKEGRTEGLNKTLKGFLSFGDDDNSIT
jgi:hypothetical protein